MSWHLVSEHLLECYCMPFGIAIQTCIEILYCIIANSIGLRCTSYDIIMVYHWLSFIGMLLHIRWYCNLNIHLFTSYIYIHCLRACCFFVLYGISCDIIIIAVHWWSFSRLLWHVTWYCNFNINWSVILYYILIMWDHIAYWMILHGL